MARRTLFEQLDDAVSATLAHPDAPLPRVNARVAPLLRLAADLRDLPRAEFKARLKSDLQRRASMAAPAVKPVREGFHTLTPYLCAREAEELIAFVTQAFGAVETGRGGPGSEGGLHAEVRIGDSMLMIGGGKAWKGESRPTSLHFYVTDADAVYRRALAAGAVSLGEPVDQPYGDREAGVKDVAGNSWYIATHKATGHAPEGLRSVTPYLHPKGAPKLIEFLKKAFAAEEVMRHETPEGTVAHAKIRIGDSMVEMGEAHGPWQPQPATFMVYVEDVDAWYARALQGGATSISAPANTPYGHYTGAVTDPFGNQWYMAKPNKGAAG
jgi:uncharacterized glyoxalase superfamily protein PhnB